MAVAGLLILLAGLIISLLYSSHWIAEGSATVTVAAPRRGILNKASDPNQEQGTTIYQCIVPKSAVWSDNKYEYVYRIDRIDDIWGTKYVIREMVVEVINSDDSDAALSSQLPAGAILAIEWNQPIYNGALVTVINPLI
jgi:hypothetical protein